jgi:hypothetical protein
MSPLINTSLWSNCFKPCAVVGNSERLIFATQTPEITSLGAHHFIVLVFEDVAMPNVAPGKAVKGNDNPSDSLRILSND